MMKGDKELEKLWTEIPTPHTTCSSTSYHRHHYHHQMFDNMGFTPSSSSSCCNMVSASSHAGVSSNNYQETNSRLFDQLMMISDRCYCRTNNGCVVGDALTQQFQNMNLGDMNDAVICTNNSRQFVSEVEAETRTVDPNACRNIPLLNTYFEDTTSPYVVDHVTAQNQSSSLYRHSSSSYYSCPFEESARLAANDCYRNGIPTLETPPSSVYHHRSCVVVDPLEHDRHCKIDFKGGGDEVFNSRVCLQTSPMYKPNEALLHPYETTLHPMNLNSTNLIHPKTVDNTLYNPSNLKGRMRSREENRGLFPQPVVLMKTAKKLDAYNALEDAYIIHERCLNGKYDPSRVRVRNYHTMPFLGNESLEFRSLMDPAAGRICENGRSSENRHPITSTVVQPTFNSLCDIQGDIYLTAKDQHGCRFLQKKFEEGSYEDVEIIFNEIIDRIIELMMNPFGNYLIQKLLDVCDEQQRTRIVNMVTRESCQLVRISLNTHGTRVVQKLIETLSTQEQISLVVLALEPGFIDLIKDLNGNHVIQRCLQCLSSEDNKFIFDAAANFCVDIATHRHGCCVLQRCIDHSNGEQRKKLIAEICANGLLLTQDPFGNYVVQYILEKKIQYVSAQLVSQFEGHYVHLSMQKFSSHVVEKCLKFYEESRPRIVHELLSVSHFDQVLQDQYANYVIQSALDVTKGHVHDSLIAAVRPHTILRTNPYCKKIFSRGLLKK